MKVSSFMEKALDTIYLLRNVRTANCISHGLLYILGTYNAILDEA